MTTELLKIRERLGVNQTTLATFLGITLRAYHDMETGKSKTKAAYIHAAEMLGLKLAAEAGDITTASPETRRLALALAAAVTGA